MLGMGRVEKIFFGLLVVWLVGVAGSAAYVLIDHATRCDRFDFHAADWRVGTSQRNDTANQLVQCHRLEGLRAAELRGRLGPPQERSGSTSWTYDAGPREGGFFVYQTLEVHFSERGMVSRARMVSESGD
jgi:hypothetical protein